MRRTSFREFTTLLAVVAIAGGAATMLLGVSGWKGSSWSRFSADARAITSASDGSHDFATVNQGELVQGAFRIVNPTDVAITMAAIPQSCGCFTVKPRRSQLGARQDCMVDFEIDTRRLIGDYRSRALVSFQFEGSPQFAFGCELRGRVTPEFSVSPSPVNLSESHPEQLVRITDGFSDGVVFVRLGELPEWLAAEIVEGGRAAMFRLNVSKHSIRPARDSCHVDIAVNGRVRPLVSIEVAVGD